VSRGAEEAQRYVRDTAGSIAGGGSAPSMASGSSGSSGASYGGGSDAIRGASSDQPRGNASGSNPASSGSTTGGPRRS
jgi:hypothetical protein